MSNETFSVIFNHCDLLWNHGTIKSNCSWRQNNSFADNPRGGQRWSRPRTVFKSWGRRGQNGILIAVHDQLFLFFNLVFTMVIHIGIIRIMGPGTPGLVLVTHAGRSWSGSGLGFWRILHTWTFRFTFSCLNSVLFHCYWPIYLKLQIFQKNLHTGSVTQFLSWNSILLLKLNKYRFFSR